MTQEEKAICYRLWESMQKDSSPWTLSNIDSAYVARIDGMTLVLFFSYNKEGGWETPTLKIEDSTGCTILRAGLMGRDFIGKMLRFLREREHNKCKLLENQRLANLSSILAGS